MRLSALNASTGGLLERGARLKPLILAALALQALVAVAMIASVADGGTLTDPSLSSRKLLQAPGPPGPQAKPPQQAPPLPPGTIAYSHSLPPLSLTNRSSQSVGLTKRP